MQAYACFCARLFVSLTASKILPLGKNQASLVLLSLIRIFVCMNAAIPTFVELGRRLASFGRRAADEAVIRAAVEANPWFTPDAIRAAVEAIRLEMLQRERLEAWTAPYRIPVAAPKRVLVVMAGNVPLVGFFDLLCVLASGHRCLVKPSSKDRVLTEYLLDELHAIDPALPVEPYDGTSRPDAVIATGSDNTNRYFRAAYGDLPALLRGSRQSVAVLAGDETAAELAGLAEDIWLHNGLGCRNVSMLLLPEGAPFPALRPPQLHPKYRNNARQTKALVEMTGGSCLDLGGALVVEQADFSTALSLIACRRYRTPEEAAAWLAVHDREIQCVVTRCLEHPRRVDFGRAQHPRLTDYPDAVDTIAFLEKL